MLQLWGSDVALARRVRPFARWLVRRASVVVCASTALAEDARGLDARDVRVIPSGVRIPESVGEPDDPPHPLRRPPLRGERRPRARRGHEGPAARRRRRRAAALAPPAGCRLVPPHELGPYYERAAVVVVPSRREGYGMAAREAMAYGRPVVATAVGGLVDALEDGVTGLLVPPGDPVALRVATSGSSSIELRRLAAKRLGGPRGSSPSAWQPARRSVSMTRSCGRRRRSL